jgi:hypothetical protein
MHHRPRILWNNIETGWQAFGHPDFPGALWDWVKSRSGYVYAMALKNADGTDIPWIKIGHTRNNPFLRARQLGHAGSVHAFDVMFAYQFADRFWAERHIHRLADATRGRGELFQLSQEKVKTLLEDCQAEEKNIFSRYVDYELLLNGTDKDAWLTHGFDIDRWIQDFS